MSALKKKQSFLLQKHPKDNAVLFSYYFIPNITLMSGENRRMKTVNSLYSPMEVNL